jgi:hypothetical protein
MHPVANGHAWPRRREPNLHQRYPMNRIAMFLHGHLFNPQHPPEAGFKSARKAAPSSQLVEKLRSKL